MTDDAVVGGVCLLLGAGGSAALWRLLGPTFDSPLFRRTNFRDVSVPVAVGVVIPLALAGVAAVLVLAEAASVVDLPLTALSATVLAATGFALLGLLDDLGGDQGARGFAGHIGALGSGRLTTGAVKLLGGGAVAVVVASAAGDRGLRNLLVDAALIALAANLANLLDRAPGRLGKAALVAAVPIVAAAGADLRLAGTLVVLGALAALLVPDLRERLMLGDTGANVVGAVVAVAAVLTTGTSTRVALLVVVAVLNVASERISFSRVIDGTPVLRWLDRLGRPDRDPPRDA